MPYNLLPIAIIFASLFCIIIILIRTFPKLALIDVSTLKEERETKAKERLIQQRMERYLQIVISKILPCLRRFSNWIQQKFRLLYKKIISLEKKYQRRTDGEGVEDGIFGHGSREVEQGLNAAEEALQKGDFHAAEEGYIEVISADSKCLAAYKGLMKVYRELKDYEKAEETGKYIVKHEEDEKERAEVLFQLSDIEKKRDEKESALQYLQQAVAIEGSNPRYLDALLDVSILMENNEVALKTFEKLHAVNPENQKLSEYKEKLEQLIVKKSVGK